MRRSGTREGFTLVELLVVIGIIALLISILLPSLARARQSAQCLAGLSNLRQIGLALQMYAQENQDFLPISKDANTTWAVHLFPYMGGEFAYNATSKPKVFMDPSAVIPQGDIHYTSNPLVMPDISRDFGGGYKVTRSYKLGQLRPDPTEISTVFDGPQMLSRNGNAENCAWQIDGGFMFGLPYGGGYRASSDPNIYTPLKQNSTYPNNDEGGGWKFPPGGDIRYRQKGDKYVNMLFGDGHADTLPMGTVTRANIRPFKNK